MYGIPYQTHEEIKETVSTLLEFEPSHFSSYSFTIEPNTPFFKYVKENNEPGFKCKIINLAVCLGFSPIF